MLEFVLPSPTLDVPAGHSVQLATSMLPCVSANVPEGHVTHFVSVAAPAWLLYLPAEHFVQASALFAAVVIE